jgi:hypothetical protein
MEETETNRLANALVFLEGGKLSDMTVGREIALKVEEVLLPR